MRRLCLLACLCLVPFLGAFAKDKDDKSKETPNIIENGTQDDFEPSFDIWTGVNAQGQLQVPIGWYPSVTETGSINLGPFAPGVAAADFGNGVLDLIVADSAGHIWYYANKGTPQAPKFDIGLPLPFFLTASPQAIQVEDFDGDKRPDLLLGDGLGNLSLVLNGGDRNLPHFTQPNRIDLVQLKTRKDSKPWCNFLTPAYAAWIEPEHKDLLMGDGTYASDNVYYLHNRGTNEKPQFDDPVVAIEGGGREQLVVMPWYPTPEGKPDLLVGDRKGKIAWYSNISAKGDAVPKFKLVRNLQLGTSESFGEMVRFGVADLNGDGKPDLLLGTPEGKILVAYNTGTAQDPKFDKAEPLLGPASPLRAKPTHWGFGEPSSGLNYPPGSFFFQLTTVGADPKQVSTYEPGFTLPEGSAEKHAFKFSFATPVTGSMSTFPVPKDEKGNEAYGVVFSPNGGTAWGVELEPNVRYEVEFDVKGTDTFERLIYHVGTAPYGERMEIEHALSPGNDWQHMRLPIMFKYSDKKLATLGCWMGFRADGKGTFYITNFAVHKAK